MQAPNSAFEVPEATEVVDLAVTVNLNNVPFARLAAEGDSHFERVLSREETTVAGRSAVRFEVESTGEGLLDRGIHSYRYHVELDELRTLTAATQVGNLDYQVNKNVLDRMVESLELDRG